MLTNTLDHINLQKLGQLLQKARKRCLMTQADAAQVINASRTTMVALEKGERRIKASELIKLARAYQCDLSDLLCTEPLAEPLEVQFRAAFRQTDQEKTEIQPTILQLEELCQHYLELEKIMKAPLPRNYPPESNVSNMPIEATAESIAIAERQRLGLGDAPILFLRDILEQGVGLRIFYLKMPSKYAEMYTYTEQLGGCMAINANHPEERRRWSLAHGYLHFLAHRHKPIFDWMELNNQYQKVPESERLAEAYAKYFLMPTSSLLRRFHDICHIHDQQFTPTNLFTLAHYYGVSVQALTYRLEEMKLLPSGTWDRLRDRGLKVRKVQEELGLQPLLARPDMTPIHYQHLAIEALDQGLITEGRFAKFLGVDRLEARHIADCITPQKQETGFLCTLHC